MPKLICVCRKANTSVALFIKNKPQRQFFMQCIVRLQNYLPHYAINTKNLHRYKSDCTNIYQKNPLQAINSWHLKAPEPQMTESRICNLWKHHCTLAIVICTITSLCQRHSSTASRRTVAVQLLIILGVLEKRTPHFFYLQKKKKSFCAAVNPWGKREKPVAHVLQALLSRSHIFQHRPFKIHLCSFVVSVLCDAGIRKLRFTSRHKPDQTLEFHAIVSTQVKALLRCTLNTYSETPIFQLRYSNIPCP